MTYDCAYFAHNQGVPRESIPGGMDRVGQRGVWAKEANPHGRNDLWQPAALPLIADASASPLRGALHLATIRRVISRAMSETLH